MAKRRREPPKPQARRSVREWWEQQQASAKRLAESPFFRDLQEHNRQLRDSPHGRRMIEDVRRWRQWQQGNLRARDTPPEATPKRRKKGGGRPLSLTDAEIARLQAAYLAMSNKPMKQSDKFEALRKELGRDNVSDSTLRRLVVAPLSK